MRNCWRILVLALVAFLLTPALAAQTAAPAAAPAPAKAMLDPVFAIELGTGHIWTGAGNYMYNLDSAQWQVHAAVSMYMTPHHGLTLAVARDGATVVEYLNAHKFSALKAPSLSYRYTCVDLAYRYTINPADKARVFLTAGPSAYFAGDLTKTGIMAGVGLEYGFTPHLFAGVKLSFRHVADFIVPQANIAETRLSVGYRF